MDVETFRATFPEFAEPTAYPEASVTFWLNLAVLRLGGGLQAARWGTLLDTGISLYMAHNLALGRRQTQVAAFGGTPGENTGPLSDKSVDKVSSSYDTQAASIEGAGNYNLTTYGTRFMELVNLVGAGPIQLSGDQLATGPYLAQW